MGNPGEIRVVVFASGPLTRWWYTVTGSPHEEIGRGSKTFYSEGHEFESGTEVTAQASATHASVARDRTLDLDVQGTFLGVIGEASPTIGYHAQEMRLLGPALDRTCPCMIRHLSGPLAVPAGSYEITRSAVQAEALAGDYVVFGADVQWPP